MMNDASGHRTFDSERANRAKLKRVATEQDER